MPSWHSSPCQYITLPDLAMDRPFVKFINMTSRIPDLRFITLSGSTNEAVANLSKLYANNEISYENVYIPRTNPKLVVFQFANESDKNKAATLASLEANLDKFKVKKYNPANPNMDCNDRKVFISNLNPAFFYCWTKENGHPETLEDKLEQFITTLKNKLGDGIIVEHHFIQHLVNGAKQTPRCMTITFNDRSSAEDFIGCDTFFGNAMLRKNQKRWNIHIPLKQCSKCKQTNHKLNDPSCPRKAKADICARCLSEDHTHPIDCTPKCWLHGLGHSSSSDRCPANISYKRTQRALLADSDRITIETQATNPQYQKIHQDVIRLQNAVNKNANSYANMLKKGKQF